MPETVTTPTPSPDFQPDYQDLVRFLVEPFLEAPESLKVDCEISQSKARIWIRVAFEGSDKGRVFGRGGRNIQAIRVVVEAIARGAGYSAHLDIYGSHPSGKEGGTEREASSDKPHPRHSSPSRASSRSRSQQSNS